MIQSTVPYCIQKQSNIPKQQSNLPQKVVKKMKKQTIKISIQMEANMNSTLNVAGVICRVGGAFSSAIVSVRCCYER